MQIFKSILESLDWPHISLIFGVIFLFMFRTQIGDFIKRVRSVGKGGVTTDTEIFQQEQNKDKSSFLQHIEIEKSILLNEIEKDISEDLESRELESESDKIKVLVRNLAITRINLDHEQTYNMIFGSQIFLLKKLNESAGVGRSKDYVIKFFGSVKDSYEEEFSDWELNQYLAFLSARSLITIKEDNYHISNKGQDFVIWMAKYGKTESKKY